MDIKEFHILIQYQYMKRSTAKAVKRRLLIKKKKMNFQNNNNSQTDTNETLEELPSGVSRVDATSSMEEKHSEPLQITTGITFNQVGSQVPSVPSTPTMNVANRNNPAVVMLNKETENVTVNVTPEPKQFVMQPIVEKKTETASEPDPEPIIVRPPNTVTERKVLPKHPGEKTVGLNMIVKNEAKIIMRCLESIKDWIDYWVICDTGSTDGTQEIITSFFQKHNIPGELHQHKWKSFGQNRTDAIKLAVRKTDYIVLIDADMALKVKNKDFKKRLGIDVYQIPQTSISSNPSVTPKRYYIRRLVDANYNYEYVGRTHECIECTSKVVQIANNDDIEFDDHEDGANRPEKYVRDIAFLEEDLAEQPRNTRTMTYLAQSYYGLALVTKGSDSEKSKQAFVKAINMYRRRIGAGGAYLEEIWYCKYNLAKCHRDMEKPWNEILPLYLEAYYYRPIRVEPLYEIIFRYRCKNEYQNGYDYSKLALNIPIPYTELLPVMTDVYNCLVIDDIAICAFHIGKMKEARRLWTRILTEGKCNETHRRNIQGNLNFCNQEIAKKASKELIDTNVQSNKPILCFYIGYATNIEPEEDNSESKAYGSELALLKLAGQLIKYYNIYVVRPVLDEHLHKMESCSSTLPNILIFKKDIRLIY